jgi:hypothetical protein
MSWLDAMLGRVQSGGVELELQGAINFTGGVTATPNPNAGRIDVSADRQPRLYFATPPTTPILGDSLMVLVTGTITVYLYDGVGTDLAGQDGWTAQFDLTEQGA